MKPRTLRPLPPPCPECGGALALEEPPRIPDAGTFGLDPRVHRMFVCACRARFVWLCLEVVDGGADAVAS